MLTIALHDRHHTASFSTLATAKDKGKAAAERKGAGRLIEGQVTTNWKQALAQLAAAYPDRMNPYL